MKKILIVEDEGLQASALRQALEKAYDVRIAQNGEIALSDAKAFSPDFILLDMILPGQSGMQVLHHLKEDSQTQHIPVVVLTNLDLEQKEPALAAGAADYLRKTDMTMEGVREMIYKHLPPDNDRSEA